MPSLGQLHQAVFHLRTVHAGIDVAVVGGGPAGLMAAEVAAAGGARVVVFEAGRTPGRKFLLAGRSGLNVTHSEPLPVFLARYDADSARLSPMIEAFSPTDVEHWCAGLGESCTIGSSGRVFPASWRAAPLLRAWLARLQAGGVEIRTRHRWIGSTDAGLRFETPTGVVAIRARTTVLACGGATWPRTGSDGAWVSAASAAGLMVRPFGPANAGLTVSWSDHMRRFLGEPIKDVVLCGPNGRGIRGDLVLVASGLQGTPAYTLAASVAPVAEAAALDHGGVFLHVDLRPDISVDALAQRLAARKDGESTANALRRLLKLSPVAIALLNECGRAPKAAAELAAYVKAVPLRVDGTEPLDRAISSTGGVAWNALDANLEVVGLPGMFAAGEMIAWNAPTGGYLLQACLSTGAWAGRAAARRGRAPNHT